MPQPDPRPKPPSRLRAAIQVLMGERLTPLQVHAEWVEYKAIFDDILQRWSASLARSAKAQRRHVERLMAEAEDPPGARAMSPKGGRKAEVRSRAAAMRGLGGAQQALRLVNGLPDIDDVDDPNGDGP